MEYTTNKISEATALTSAGEFNADMVMSTIILSWAFGGVNVFRTTEVPKDLRKDVIIFNIGEESARVTYRENGVPYANCGKMWRSYGMRIETIAKSKNPQMVWKILDEELIQGIDAVTQRYMPKVAYITQEMGICKLIEQFNSNWNEELPADDRFDRACEFADTIFENALAEAIARVEANEIVEKAIADSTDGIMFLDKLMPFEKVLFASKNPKAKGIFFVIYQAQDKTWVCETVPTKAGKSYSRKHFPLDWLGARARLLQEITGVRTAWSCDPNGKFCTTVYKEDAIALANLVMSEE